MTSRICKICGEDEDVSSDGLCWREGCKWTEILGVIGTRERLGGAIKLLDKVRIALFVSATWPNHEIAMEITEFLNRNPDEK